MRRSRIIGLVVAALIAVPLQVLALFRVLDTDRDQGATERGEPSGSGTLVTSDPTTPSASPLPGVSGYWVANLSEEGGFSVWAPGHLEEREFDEGVTIHRLELGGTIVYTVDWFDWYGITHRDAHLVRMMIRRSARRYDAELVERENSPLDGHPGAFLWLDTEDTTMLIRMVAVNGRFYTITATFHRGARWGTRPTARAFLNSLELLA